MAGRAKSVKVFFRGLSVKSILLSITYFYNSDITEEKKNDIEKRLCCLVVVLREVTIHI